MVLAKSKKSVGLGNSLMNDRFGKGKGSDRKKVSAGAIQRTGTDGQTYVTNAKKEAEWVKMQSVTEQAALEEFLSTAELAGTDFTAEKMDSVKIIHTDQYNPYLLSAQEEKATLKKHKAHKARLTVPRRPAWDETTTPRELDDRERASLLEWRRGLADLQENHDLLMTPFERNIEVWRQLWRVIERSDLVVQIVDARNPLLFRCDDLEKYVKEVHPEKKVLLLVNKADMMTLEQRQAWAEYFVGAGINYKFFSAHLAKEMNEARLDDSSSDEERPMDRITRGTKKIKIQQEAEDDEEWDSEEDLDKDNDEDTRILTVDELEDLFIDNAPEYVEDDESDQRKAVIGLVGYPNVGKSSTINALIGTKKVSVSATPGHTKHFQTIHLSPNIILCDCPGLVFPNFATTKAELVCSGVLPIDQQREFYGPAGLVAQRIPKAFFEAMYNLKVTVRPIEDGGTGVPTASDILKAYARSRGFFRQGAGMPDEARASRYVLKDYVNGKLLYCHPPPIDPPINGDEFNRELYDVNHLPENYRAAFAAKKIAEASGQAEDDVSLMDQPDTLSSPAIPWSKTSQLDKGFFGSDSGSAGHMKMPFSYKYTEQGSKELSGRKAKQMTALEKGVDVGELKNSKKHFKGDRRKKVKARPDEDFD